MYLSSVWRVSIGFCCHSCSFHCCRLAQRRALASLPSGLVLSEDEEKESSSTRADCRNWLRLFLLPPLRHSSKAGQEESRENEKSLLIFVHYEKSWGFAFFGATLDVIAFAHVSLFYTTFCIVCLLRFHFMFDTQRKKEEKNIKSRHRTMIDFLSTKSKPKRRWRKSISHCDAFNARDSTEDALVFFGKQESSFFVFPFSSSNLFFTLLWNAAKTKGRKNKRAPRKRVENRNLHLKMGFRESAPPPAVESLIAPLLLRGMFARIKGQSAGKKCL